MSDEGSGGTKAVEEAYGRRSLADDEVGMQYANLLKVVGDYFEIDQTTAATLVAQMTVAVMAAEGEQG